MANVQSLMLELYSCASSLDTHFNFAFHWDYVANTFKISCAYNIYIVMCTLSYGCVFIWTTEVMGCLTVSDNSYLDWEVHFVNRKINTAGVRFL